MVYRKKAYKRTKRKAPTNLSLQKQITSLKKSAEVKTHERYIDEFPSFNGEIFELAAVSLEQTNANADFRTGNSIKCKMLKMNYKIRNPFTQFNSVRVIVFHDKNQTILDVGDYLAPIELGTGEATLSFRFEGKKYNSKLLYDRVHDMSINDQLVTVRKNIKLNFYSQYNGVQTIPEAGSLKVILVANKDSTDNTRAAFNGAFQLYYTDM